MEINLLNKDRSTQLNSAEYFVYDSFGVDRKLLYSKTRSSEVVKSRFIVWYVLNKVFTWNINTIARNFGKNHSTVIHGVNFVVKSDWGKSIREEIKFILINRKHLL